MIETVIRTEDVPRAERLDYWCAMVCPMLLASMLRTDEVDDFRASMRGLDLGTVQVARAAGPSVRLHRSPKLVRQHDPETFLLWCTLTGGIGVSQGGREAVVEAGDMVLYDSSRPFHCATVDGHDGVAGVVMTVPKSLFPIGPDLLVPLTATRLSARAGMGRWWPVIWPRWSATPSATPGRHHADGHGHHGPAGGLVRARVGGGRPPPAGDAAAGLLGRIHRFVLSRLGDPELTPAVVAAAHQISPRYLHKLFEGQGSTVAAWIRERRLERCRRDLADPAWRSGRSTPWRPAGDTWTRRTSVARSVRPTACRPGLPPGRPRRAFPADESAERA
ncbi:hypothetical protein NKH77_05140 [Streptomyces sp. M19]